MSKVAVLLGPDYEDSEFEVPLQAFRRAGHSVTVIGSKAGQSLLGKKGKSKAVVEVAAADANVGEFSAVVIPGGYSPDHLRTDASVVDFVDQAARAKKVIAAVCHGPSLLIEAELCRGLRVTSWPSIRKDLVNAGAHWEDEPVVRDGNIITSRQPEDLAAFSDAILSQLGLNAEPTASLTSSQL
jgi:protease I